MNGIALWVVAIQLGCLYHRLYWLALSWFSCTDPSAAAAAGFFLEFCISEVAIYCRALFVKVLYLEYVYSLFIHGITETKLRNIFLSSSPAPKRKHFVSSLFSP